MRQHTEAPAERDPLEVRMMKEAQEDSRREKDLVALLSDCYMALHDRYYETSMRHDSPPEPADEWSNAIIPLFAAIQSITGKNHDQLMLQQKAKP